MFDINLIKKELSGLVGFKQPANPKHAIIDAENQKSLSGLFATDNPYVKIEYLIANVDYNRMDAGMFNEFLKDLRETSATNICSQIFIEDDFVDRNLIYTNTQNKVATTVLPKGFIGYSLNITTQKNVGFRINRAIFDFAIPTTVKLLVFNSNVKEPIFQKEIVCDEFYHNESIDFAINTTGYIRGKYYIGFITDGTTEVYSRDYRESNQKNQIKGLQIESVVVNNHIDELLFDLNKVNESSNSSGFNLDLTVVDDHSDFIVTNKYLFSRAIYLDCIISCLAIYAASLRSNADERNAEELYGRVMIEIEGTRPDDNVISIRGLRPQIVYEISQIREQIVKLRGGFFGRGYMVETQD